MEIKFDTTELGAKMKRFALRFDKDLNEFNAMVDDTLDGVGAYLIDLFGKREASGALTEIENSRKQMKEELKAMFMEAKADFDRRADIIARSPH